MTPSSISRYTGYFLSISVDHSVLDLSESTFFLNTTLKKPSLLKTCYGRGNGSVCGKINQLKKGKSGIYLNILGNIC